MPDTLSSYAQSQPDKPGVIDDQPDGTVVTPRTGSGKLLKRQLRAPYWAGRTAQVG